MDIHPSYYRERLRRYARRHRRLTKLQAKERRKLFRQIRELSIATCFNVRRKPLLVQRGNGWVHCIRMRDFTTTPGGRKTSHGDYSAEEFFYYHLYPAFEAARFFRTPLLLDLSGTYGYALSFLDELAMALVEKAGVFEVRRFLLVESADSPDHAKDFLECLEEHIALGDQDAEDRT